MKNRIFIILLAGAGINCSAQNIVRKADSIRVKYEIPELAYAVVAPEAATPWLTLRKRADTIWQVKRTALYLSRSYE